MLYRLPTLAFPNLPPIYPHLHELLHLHLQEIPNLMTLNPESWIRERSPDSKLYEREPQVVARRREKNNIFSKWLRNNSLFFFLLLNVSREEYFQVIYGLFAYLLKERDSFAAFHLCFDVCFMWFCVYVLVVNHGSADVKYVKNFFGGEGIEDFSAWYPKLVSVLTGHE